MSTTISLGKFLAAPLGACERALRQPLRLQLPDAQAVVMISAFRYDLLAKGRAACRIEHLSSEVLTAIESERMNECHDHLNTLLD